MTAPGVTPDSILQIGFGFWASKTLLSAVELGLFSELAKAPRNLEDLSHTFKLHPRSARDFLDTLVALRILERTDGNYRNTPAADLYLDRAKPTYVGGILEMANQRLYPFWGHLTEALHTGELQNEAKGGGPDPFAAMYADPANLEGFLKAMTGISRPAAQAIARKFPWDRYKSFVDVGCAQGAVGVELCRTHEHLNGTGFDLPAVGPIYSKHVQTEGLADRLAFKGGTFFKDPLPSADVIIMGHILHDWGIDDKRMLLRKAHAALPPGGAILAYDAVIDDDRRENAFGLMMSLNMLIETPAGFDYTGADCQGWMKEAGFRETRVEHLVGPDSMVIGIK
jgi:precorrin-6B methylase 2